MGQRQRRVELFPGLIHFYGELLETAVGGSVLLAMHRRRVGGLQLVSGLRMLVQSSDGRASGDALNLHMLIKPALTLLPLAAC